MAVKTDKSATELQDILLDTSVGPLVKGVYQNTPIFGSPPVMVETMNPDTDDALVEEQLKNLNFKVQA